MDDARALLKSIRLVDGLMYGEGVVRLVNASADCWNPDLPGGAERTCCCVKPGVVVVEDDGGDLRFVLA